MLATAVLLLVAGVWGQLDPRSRTCVDSCGGLTNATSPSDMLDEDFLNSNCFCDAECADYGDCCLDRALEINRAPEDPWVCNSLATQPVDPISGKPSWVKIDVYMIGACPPQWSDQLVDNHCRRDLIRSLYTFVMDVPVISRLTHRTYVNIFCALCHSDANDLVSTTVRLTCPTFLLDCRQALEKLTYSPQQRLWRLLDAVVSFSVAEQDDPRQLVAEHSLRRCRQVLDKCDTPEDTDDTDSVDSCPIFANYTYIWADASVVYKNPCVACRDDLSKLYCIPTAFPIGTNQVSSKSSFALLLDINEMYGEWVGIRDSQNIDKILLPTGNQNLSEEATNASVVLGCEVMAIYPPNFSLNPNGSLHLHNFSLVLDKTDYVVVGTEYNVSSVWVCVEDEQTESSPRFSLVQNRLSLSCLGLSVTCLVAHIAIYSVVPKLRNLPGRNLLSLAACLLLGQVLFLGVDQVPYMRLCEVMAVVMHYAFLAAFFWMNVMAIDICRTFTSPYYQNDAAGQAKNYRRYSRYAWLLSALIVGIALLLDHSNLIPSLSPQYGKGFCWITRRRALLVFFALPMAVLLFENIIFFVLTARGIYRTVQSTQIARRCSDRIRFYLYVKLALLMGLGWLLGFAAAFADSDPLWLVFILLNATQGVFILVAFSMKPKILRLVFEKMPCPLRKRINRSLQLAATSATNLTIAITKLSSSTPQLNQE